jgi:DNA-binding MarR family transcriptional regulator
MGLPATTVSSIVNRLDRRTHIRRVPNALDARSYLIELTPAGRKALRAADKLFRPVLSQVQAGLDRPTADVRNVLAAVTDAARQADADRP